MEIPIVPHIFIGVIFYNALDNHEYLLIHTPLG